jgi:hypothetical protein
VNLPAVAVVVLLALAVALGVMVLAVAVLASLVLVVASFDEASCETSGFEVTCENDMVIDLVM